MNYQMRSVIILCIILTFGFTSCTSYRALEDERAKTARADKARTEMQVQYDIMKQRMDSTEETRTRLTKLVDQLKKDTSYVNASLRSYVQLDAENKKRMDQLSKTTDRILDVNLSENDRLLNQIKAQKEDLRIQKEELDKKQAAFEATQAEFNKAQGDLGEKESRIRDLQMALDKKDAAVKELQRKVSDALVGFKASGLTVVERDGKVYVLLPEALLFKSGSKNIESNGKDAINQLATILRSNPDINIAVNVPYKAKTAGSLVEDNWDLSVVRATSVVKALTYAGVSPLRISAQGRGEYLPIDSGSTKEARAVNRRTEIILTPKLDVLLKSIE